MEIPFPSMGVEVVVEGQLLNQSFFLGIQVLETHDPDRNFSPDSQK